VTVSFWHAWHANSLELLNNLLNSLENPLLAYGFLFAVAPALENGVRVSVHLPTAPEAPVQRRLFVVSRGVILRIYHSRAAQYAYLLMVVGDFVVRAIYAQSHANAVLWLFIVAYDGIVTFIALGVVAASMAVELTRLEGAEFVAKSVIFGCVTWAVVQLLPFFCGLASLSRSAFDGAAYWVLVLVALIGKCGLALGLLVLTGQIPVHGEASVLLGKRETEVETLRLAIRLVFKERSGRLFSAARSAQLAGCADKGTLLLWLGRASHATSENDIFEPASRRRTA
jgi:hypothetical protein